MHKCPACAVEFALLSWRLNRPDEVAVTCPECQSSAFLLGTIPLSTRRSFSMDGVEIYKVGGILVAAAEPPERHPRRLTFTRHPGAMSVRRGVSVFYNLWPLGH